MAILIGTPGWSLRQGSRLAVQFPVAEISSTFNRPAERRTVERWLDLVRLNPDFRFTVVLGRQFTHERLLAGTAIAFFKEGLWPLVRERRMGALTMRFPEDFRFNVKNHRYLLDLRRAFHEFPLVAELSHETWLTEEGRGVLIDHKVGLAGGGLTSGLGYVRVMERDPDFDGLEKTLSKLAMYADRAFAIFEHESAAQEMQARLSELAIAPAQSRLDFGRAVA